jgi:hypothetical protein
MEGADWALARGGSRLRRAAQDRFTCAFRKAFGPAASLRPVMQRARALPRVAGALGALALATLLLAPGWPGAAAQSSGPVDLIYTIDATDGALLQEGKVRVTWRASNFQGRISAFCLQVDVHEYAIDKATFGPAVWVYHPSDVSPTQGKPACPAGFRALTRDINSVSADFELDVRKPAFSACGCEFNSFLGTEWGVVKAESLAIPFSYAFFEPQPAFHATVRFILPEGWSVEAPWARGDPTSFEIAEEPPLPRGFFALGSFVPEPHVSASIGKEFVYVRLAAELKDKRTLFDYLEKATPYYQGVYGNATGNRILVVSAGPPMFTGGLGSTDSLFVHQNSTLDTIAHEFAHVWQRFQTVDQQGRSSIWLNEGDADLHGALSRFVTEVQSGYTLDALNKEFKVSYDANRAKDSMQQPLDAASYGGTFEQLAYKKGLFTLIELDHTIKNLTGGAAGLNEVLRELNVEFDRNISSRQGEKRLTNEDILAVADKVVQRTANFGLINFWRAFVWGNSTDTCAPGCWPQYRELPPEAPIVFDGLEVAPTEAESGAPLTVRVIATNVRPSSSTREVELLLDDERVASKAVTLGPGASQPLVFGITAGAPGAHTVRVAYLRQGFRVLVPADLAVESVSAPREAQAMVPFDVVVRVQNRGEAATVAKVSVALDGQERDATVDVAGGGSADARLAFVAAGEGALPAEVTLRWGNRTIEHSATVDVGPRDRDDDGVADGFDAYPDNGKLSQKNVLNDVRNSVPGFEALMLVATMIALAMVRRRRP